MFEIYINTHFSAGHHLRDYPGNCEHPHGHNWNVKVTVKASKLDNLGMGIDFRILKNAVNKVMDNIDHCDLNSHEAFLTINPSSENIAVFIFDTLKDDLHSDNYQVHSVNIEETPGSGVTYFGS